jgi:hypothetical protein
MPRLRDGVIKRGGSWSYVIRVPDPATGVSKPKWVGGFDTEDDAKAARDEARVRARHGEYVNRSTFTVADYLAEWVEAHASTVKPKTLAGYRHDIDHYIVPRIGRMRLQALRPAVISRLYRDLAEHGGPTADPCQRSRFPTYIAPCARPSPTPSTSSSCLPQIRPQGRNGPRAALSSPSKSGPLNNSAHSSPPPGLTGYSPSIVSPPTRAHDVANCCTCDGPS